VQIKKSDKEERGMRSNQAEGRLGKNLNGSTCSTGEGKPNKVVRRAASNSRDQKGRGKEVDKAATMKAVFFFFFMNIMFFFLYLKLLLVLDGFVDGGGGGGGVCVCGGGEQ
jgi:hypothetical protein